MRRRVATLPSVRRFWERESCGERYASSDGPDYDEIDAVRYRLEPHIPSFARFGEQFGGRALEIGLGTGSDFAQNIARGGAWIGLDLTERSLRHVRGRIRQAAPVLQGDAQNIPFAPNSFDLVYSWGVLICCPCIESAVSEVHRVLKDDGVALIMLYHARSWVSVAAWLRWGWFRGISPPAAVSYMESPGTQALSRADARRLFSAFRSVSIRTVRTSWDTRWLGPIGRIGGDAMGFHLLCEVVK